MSEDFDALKEQKERILQAQEEREFQEAIEAAGGVDAFLRQHGYDPDAVGKRMNAVAQQALREMEDALETVDRIAQRLGVAFSVETRDELAAIIHNRGLHQVPDEPDDAPQGSVSQPVSAMGRADAPLRPEKTEDDQITPAILKQVIDVAYRFEEMQTWDEALADADFLQIWSSRAIVKLNQIASAYKDREAARVAEAVAQERARIVAAFNDITSYYCPLADGSEGPPHLDLFTVARILHNVTKDTP
jgi:hypothetical protein